MRPAFQTSLMRYRTALKTGRTAELQLEALRGYGLSHYRAIVQRLAALVRRFF